MTALGILAVALAVMGVYLLANGRRGVGVALVVFAIILGAVVAGRTS